jgi:hypothetical protein
MGVEHRKSSTNLTITSRGQPSGLGSASVFVKISANGLNEQDVGQASHNLRSTHGRRVQFLQDMLNR